MAKEEFNVKLDAELYELMGVRIDWLRYRYRTDYIRALIQKDLKEGVLDPLGTGDKNALPSRESESKPWRLWSEAAEEA